ncbi:MAG TPA: peptide MFS transporter [Chitinophagales bacterium]|nr:peptide MFS transporter [Chitinophagales bacterium]HMX04642.1 peptide MFS transporter [Chitinophagales bacterium]HNE46000.1 peptide MFS transporter [Chitinophagales bacterium]HNF69090.1 peptide MFS transporter [Chitinophagales bacterium]HNI52898.1 peptide MFS transporter [Chitinophagales bacterium]
MSQPAKGHPKGLYVLFFTEMWERFSYYGMRAIFLLYLTDALVYAIDDASNIYGSYTGLVYLTPLLGGYISDKYWGNRRSIFTGGILMAIGQFLMFTSGSMLANPDTAKAIMLVALTFLIVGNGFFKPNISTMVGQLYPKGDSRVDSAFTIFYMGINLGAFFSPLVCGGLGDTGNPGDFKWGFLAAGIGMIVSVIAFEFLKNKYLVTPDGRAVGMPPKYYESAQPIATNASTNTLDNVDMENAASPKETPNFDGKMVGIAGVVAVGLFAVFYFLLGIDLIGSCIFSVAIAIPYLIITDKSLNSHEKSRIWVIFILAFFVIFFWSAFEQAGASLTYFADKQTDRNILGWEMPASWFQSINPLGIIILAPLFSMLWVALAKRKREPASPLKMAIGLFLLCLGYIVIAFGVKGVDPSIKISMWFLVMLYLLHTMGELCLSPIGLSMVSKLAPLRFASLLMGTWFLANAAANKLAGTLSALIPPGEEQFQKAQAAGIDLNSILNGTTAATADQAKVMTEQAIPTAWPSLMGMEITNLYQFFMVFIVMSGVAAFILFFLSGKLKTMMHTEDNN